MKTYIFLLVFAIQTNLLLAQDISFSQVYNVPLLRNPALAGVFDGDVRINGAFRNQWQSISVPFRSAALSAEYKIPLPWEDWITVGVQATHDIAGDIKLKRTQLLPVINYHKSLSADADDYLSLGIMAGPVQSQFDPTQLKMDDQFQNGSFNPNSSTSQVFQRTGFSYWDASVGMSFSSGFGENSRYYVGAALFHFNKPKVAFYTSNSNVVLDPKFAVNAGLKMFTSDVDYLDFFVDYFKQSGHAQVTGGAFYNVELQRDYDTDASIGAGFGAMYRWNDAVIPAVKLDYYGLAIGLSYDVTVSKLKTVSQMRGGFELTASYKIKLANRSYFADKVRCVRY